MTLPEFSCRLMKRAGGLVAEKLQGGATADIVRRDELAPVVNSLRGHYAHSPQVQGFVGLFEQLRRMKGD